MSVFLDLSSIDVNQSSSKKVGNELKDFNESRVDNDSDEEPDVENLVTFENWRRSAVLKMAYAPTQPPTYQSIHPYYWFYI